ncbi:hypothetical protein HWV62_38172 [Athelia sp. TMB]|nr:hypothetical protein HWV62_38172 [Athelia sp. TMB]
MPKIPWTPEKVREVIRKRFDKRACWYQVKTALALYAKKDVVGKAPTGSGKTLSFFVGLVMAMEEEPEEENMIFIVSPLNLLSKQNVETLNAAGLPAISLTSENNNVGTFQEIESRRFRVVVVSQEILMQKDGICGFTKLWKKPQFTNRILYFVFDEGHCISQWSSFQKEYLTICTLRYIIPERIPFYIVSVTLPTPILLDLSKILRLRPSETEHVTLSCDHPDIHLVAWQIQYPVNTFHDLDFFVKVPPDFIDGVSPPPPKFLISLTGMDLPDVDIVAQWRATCDMCDLWQRFGRVARATGREGTGILFYQKAHLDGAREHKKAVLVKLRETEEDALTNSREIERKAKYNQRASSSVVATWKSKNVKDTNPALDMYGPMDDFINAGTREDVHCRHKPVKLYFDGPTKPADVHHLCDKTIRAGCSRCAPHTSSLCCDTCHPEHFDSLFISQPPEKIARAPNRSCIKAYEATNMEKDLKSELRVWREEQAVVVLGRMTVRKWGAILFMSDEIIQRIVDCAHDKKITTADHIAKETRWRRDYVDKCADSILALINKHVPPSPVPPPPASRVLAALDADESNTSAPAKRVRQPNRCGLCKALGHNKSNASCPARLALNRAQALEGNENQPPAAASTSTMFPVASGSQSAPPPPAWQQSSDLTPFQFVTNMGTPTAPLPTVPPPPAFAFNLALQSNPNVYSRRRAPPPY